MLAPFKIQKKVEEKRDVNYFTRGSSPEHVTIDPQSRAKYFFLQQSGRRITVTYSYLGPPTQEIPTLLGGQWRRPVNPSIPK